MPYSIPPYIAGARIDDPKLRFVWDDTRAQSDFKVDTDALVAPLGDLTLHAKIAVGIGIYEWIVWRFRSVSADPLPFHVAEAAWCANVDRRYMEYDEWDRREWTGPVRGPLWYATTWLMPMVFFGDDRPEESESGLSLLSRLAFHVLTRPGAFEGWLDAVAQRMLTFYRAPSDDGFSDLFGEREEERRGSLVPPEALDPAVEYRPEMAKSMILKFLRGVDYRQNPLLQLPDELARRGFDGAPYSL